MISSSRLFGISAPLRAPDTGGQRPLPAGVVGLSQLSRGGKAERREAAPSGTLIVGRGIRVKGKIDACQSLVVEGRVEASLTADKLEVMKDGTFTGSAEVERAEIAGAFDGTLTVRDQLSIKSGGRVSGTTRYGQIKIDAGGAISGDVDSEAGAQAPAKDNVA
jgi:cytoskeletal protein CcmA (bactofilin family)